MIKSTGNNPIFQKRSVLKGGKPAQPNLNGLPKDAGTPQQRAELKESFQRTSQAQELMDASDVAETSGKKNWLKTAGFVALGIIGVVAGGPVGVAVAAGGLIGGTITSVKAAKDMKESNALREQAFEILSPGQTPADPTAPLTMMETPLQ